MKTRVCLFWTFSTFGQGSLLRKKFLEGHCENLGVTIDGELNFREHVSHVTKELNKVFGRMFKVRHL